MVTSLTNIAIPALSGILVHSLWLNRGEHHLYGLRYIVSSCIVYGAGIWILKSIAGYTLEQSFHDVNQIARYFFLGLTASLLCYRVVFSPIRRFPGPISLKMSGLFLSTQLIKQDAFRKVLALHQKYGDFVRIGSNDVSIIHPGAVSAIYGKGSRCRKADWYDLTQPMVSLQTTRNVRVHAERRKVWSGAFGDKALRGYEQRIQTYQNILIDKMNDLGQESIEVAHLFRLFSFDIMGDLAFGTCFDMLQSGREHWAIKLFNEGIVPLGFMLPVWFFRIAVAIPMLADDWWKFIHYCSARLDDRMKTAPTTPDVMAALLEPHKKERPTAEQLMMLQGDAQLIVVAGSDTTATTLTHCIYTLLCHPEHIIKIRKEVEPFVDDDGCVQNQDLQYLDHLNACINETLRLFPPVPTALPRLTPPEGISIGGTHIPGNTTVIVPQYALARQESIYAEAEKFVPERWYSKPEMIKEKSAFAPFSIGSHGCIGKPLALQTIRTTLARILVNFDLSFGHGETGQSIVEESSEHFILAPGKLNVCFQKRTL